MRSSIEKLVVLLAVAFLTTGLARAQQSTTAGGGDATGSGGTMAYSLGQVEFTTNANGVGIAAQGVQHAYETFTIGIVQTTLNASLTAFPIPVKENLTLKVSNYNDKKLSYCLYDMHGKIVLISQIFSPETEINMINMAAESYSLVVFNDGQIVKYIQIIKTN
jgi:hypothetical protein